MIAKILGLTNPNGSWYLFWSGFGGHLWQFPVIGVVLHNIQRHTCHHPYCIRPRKYPVDKPEYCLKHKDMA